MASMVVDRGLDPRILGVRLPDEFPDVVMAFLRARDAETAAAIADAHEQEVRAQLRAQLEASPR